jgi:subtilisin family serine protease
MGFLRLPFYLIAITALFGSLGAWPSAQADEATPVDNPPFAPAPAISQLSNSAVTVAVIDSGVDYNHRLIRGVLYDRPKELEGLVDHDGNGFAGDVHGWDFKQADAYPFDYIAPLPPLPPPPTCDPLAKLDTSCILEYSLYGAKVAVHLLLPGDAGHGTHCAGIVAQAARGDARILPLRIDYSSDHWLEQVHSALEYAVSSGARVVSMSFGTYLPRLKTAAEHEQMRQIEEFMRAHPRVFFAIAAGNDNVDMASEGMALHPAAAATAAPNVVAVGAVDYQGNLASFSNVGRGIVDLYAPGVEVLSSWPGKTKLVPESGTSMATPFVAGRAARVLAAKPELDGAGVHAALVAESKIQLLRFEKTNDKAAKALPLGTSRFFFGNVLFPEK